jgi:type II secretory pathway component GspD/PulD (secretin)
MKRSTKLSMFGMVSMMAVSACSSNHSPGFERGTSDRINAQTQALADKSETVRRGGAVDADRAFLGRNMTPSFDQYAVDHGKPFPARFERADALEIVTPEPASIGQIELLMQELTGLNVVVRTRYQSGEQDLDIPINKKIRVNHKGSLSSLVRTIASRYDLAWSFDGETITFDRMDTRSYDLPLPAASGAISASLSGVKVAGNSVSSTKNVALDPWKEITAAIEAVIEDPATVTVSPNTGSITVFAPASAQAEAAKIIKNFDELYSRRIGLEIATFYVDTARSAELTADLGVSVNSGDLTASLGQGLTSALQGGIGVISGSDVSASFNLQNIAGSQAVADFQSSNTVAQNGVVAPVVLTNSQKYVSEISTGDEDSSATIQTDFIDSGISIYSIPRLMRNGKIHLSVWVTQAELNGLETFDTGSGFVQLPDSDQRAVEYTLIMEPGETLVMGGYEQERSSSSREGGLGGLSALGLRDSRSGGTERSRLVLMVRPTIIGN